MQHHVSECYFHRVNAISLHAYILLLFISTVGPVFDNTYHDFLITKIIENDAFSFDINVHPFTDPSGIFPSWFRVMPPGGGLDHLDTDIALAFPSLNTIVHPNFHLHSIDFAKSNDYFLKMFFVALQKMSKLGVKVELFPATHCEPMDCIGVQLPTDTDAHFLGGKPTRADLLARFFTLIPNNVEIIDFATSEDLPAHEILRLLKELGNSTAFADQATRKIQAGRFDEIIKLTTPVNRKGSQETAKPTLRAEQTAMPTKKPSESTVPTSKPSPTPKPTTSPNTTRPTTQVPTPKPTPSPTTPRPSAVSPTPRPTLLPTPKPTTAPTMPKPTSMPTMPKPTTMPTTRKLTPVPTSKPSTVVGSTTKPPVVVIRPTAKPTSKPTVRQVPTTTEQVK